MARTILVTGGTRGIGYAIAKLFLQKGNDVIITGRGEDCKEKLTLEGFIYIQVDFSKEGYIDTIESFLSENELCIDVLVNNAGINNIKFIDEVDELDYDELLGVNLKAPYFLSKISARHMSNKGGHIVNISSIMSVTSREKRSLYSSSKSGLVGMTKALSAELGPKNILVNCVSPGFTLTDLTRESLSQEEMDDFASKIPLRRLAEVEEMANVVYFISSPKNSYITGQNIIADGGFTSV